MGFLDSCRVTSSGQLELGKRSSCPVILFPARKSPCSPGALGKAWERASQAGRAECGAKEHGRGTPAKY